MRTNYSNEKGVILTIVLIFSIILSIIAGSVVILMTNQARLTESQIKRIRAFYTAQAAITATLQSLREGTPPVTPITLNDLDANVTWQLPGAGTGPFTTRRITATVQY